VLQEAQQSPGMFSVGRTMEERRHFYENEAGGAGGNCAA